MDGVIRLAAAVNKVNCANPMDCGEEVRRVLGDLPGDGCDIVVFPQLALSSPSCGNLFLGRGLLEQCDRVLGDLVQDTRERDGYVLVGLPVDGGGRPVSVMAVVHRGQVVALVPAVDSPPPFINSSVSELFAAPDTVFACGPLRFCVVGCDLATLTQRAVTAAETGCDLLIFPAYAPVYAGMIDQVCDCARVVSGATGCAVAVVNGGVGDTSSPYLYGGFIAVYENGAELVRETAEDDSITAVVDLDVDIIRAEKTAQGGKAPFHSIPAAPDRPDIRRPIRQNPFLPEENPERYLSELFEMQARSLAARLENTGFTKLVVGVSGGLDSTAALLAAVAAADRLELPRSNIIGITMPGFGTSDRTYYNALALLEKLGVMRRDISIKAAVLQHFEDIGHSGKQDTTYENAQARERTQILLDVANLIGGIVVGTGDLSEEALGFCTFAGDHMANYNVNVCITKTVLRELVRHLAHTDRIAGVGEILLDIVDTPISPELLPLGQAGEIQQKTEDILGPYGLHDFFLYYFVRYHLRPGKLLAYACKAFQGELEPAYIQDKLAVFFRRFCAGQFKRSCSPDAATITMVNLCGVHYYIPSDLDPSALLRELEEQKLPESCTIVGKSE